ncbi:uncharacterized protein MYU51_020497 [Penicillium brevicompactum]
MIVIRNTSYVIKMHHVEVPARARGALSQMSLRRLLVSQMSLRGALLTQDLGCGELAPPCGVHLVTQRPPARIIVDAEPVLRGTLDNAEPVLRGTLDDAEPILRSTVDNAELVLRDTVDNAEPILRGTLDNAEPILRGLLLTQDLVCGELASPCGVHLVTQRPPARIVGDADLSCEAHLITQSPSCEAPSYTRGAHGSEGAHSYIAGLVAATAVATETLTPAGKRGTT